METKATVFFFLLFNCLNVTHIFHLLLYYHYDGSDFFFF